MDSNTVLSVATILAIIAGPIASLYIQRQLDEERASLARKLNIFRALIAHRATRLSAPFVEALNSIEVEFYSTDNSTRRIVEAWREYCDHLYSPGADDPTKASVWSDKTNDLLNTLLSEMGEYLGYHFEKGTLKKMVYNPQGWVNVEQEQHSLRKSALEVFSGQKPLHVTMEGPS